MMARLIPPSANCSNNTNFIITFSKVPTGAETSVFSQGRGGSFGLVIITRHEHVNARTIVQWILHVFKARRIKTFDNFAGRPGLQSVVDGRVGVGLLPNSVGGIHDDLARQVAHYVDQCENDLGRGEG